MREIFDALFADVAAGRPAAFTLHHANGGSHHYEPAAWFRDRLPGDRGLLDACTGPTLDVGCGPGRLAGALAAAGWPVLGIDISDAAVRHAQRRGALALRRDVFEPVPGAGRWQHLLLADGNIGIGGDPRRLLRRCRQLLAPGGRLHAEVAAPGTRGWAGTVTVGRGPGAAESTMRWAAVPLDEVAALAAATALRVIDTRTEAGRWFVSLSPR
ncbi:class I SAM-dependent methyltransferase [Paractinoplanes ferrugineus]|uniref:Methyltransferase type 12 n=1 Tax=Paractinoplanes ferrugineus TaxID=113564 RepID=A0A919J681_9ACTN|nr:class I SAM-dependent methyltransferase [Actinoplanes ferrugineus]GIE14630.1 methyltransferase type 12 [Actinoplanes ferrugineus]